jgi:hypothetical protein
MASGSLRAIVMQQKTQRQVEFGQLRPPVMIAQAD